jgi:thioredoxin 1
MGKGKVTDNTVVVLREKIQSGRAVLVDYHASWCGPCREVPPLLRRLELVYGEGLDVVEFDIDSDLEFVKEERILGVPTLVLYVGGREVWRESGVWSYEHIVSGISSHLSYLSACLPVAFSGPPNLSQHSD